VLPNYIFIQQAHSWPFGELQNSPAPYVASCLTSRVAPVEFHNCKECHESSREMTDSYYVLKGHPSSSQSGIILVEFTQIRWFLRLSGGGGWSGSAVAQWRPRVSKLGLKGLSDYHSNETAVEAVRQGASGPNKRATLINYLLKKESLQTALSLTEKGQEAARQMKSTPHKKEKLLTLTPGDVADGRRLRR
jgi:hypothetical protein